MALSLLAGWLFVGRAVTASSLTALAYLAAAGTMAAALALAANWLLKRRPWTARLAAALFLLIAGTVGLASFLIGIETAMDTHDLGDVPLRTVLVILALTSAATLYNFLAVAGFLMLPLGAPIMVLFALAIAGMPR